VLVRQRTQLKNRVHATLAKYALAIPAVSDLFGRQGRTSNHVFRGNVKGYKFHPPYTYGAIGYYNLWLE
jgi:hypothetical protein